MNKFQKGFTLIELMIVVAIIGILVTAAIPAYQDYVVKARLSRVKTSLEPVKLALAMFYQENGTFFAGSTGKSTSNSAPADFWNSIGLASVTLPDEVDGTAFVVDGTVGSSGQVSMAVKLRSIKAGTIDGHTITITGTAGATAIVWTCTPDANLDQIAIASFGC